MDLNAATEFVKSFFDSAKEISADWVRIVIEVIKLLPARKRKELKQELDTDQQRHLDCLIKLADLTDVALYDPKHSKLIYKIASASRATLAKKVAPSRKSAPAKGSRVAIKRSKEFHVTRGIAANLPPVPAKKLPTKASASKKIKN